MKRARLHAGLGDPHRVSIVDALTLSDRSPSELANALGIESNLLAHHLGVLERLGFVERVTSQGDRRRRYATLVPATLASLQRGLRLRADRIVFVCTENSDRSQLAEAIWNQSHPVVAISGGIRPATRLHPGALRAAARRDLDLGHAQPKPLPEFRASDVVITVCDRAHESLQGLHHVHRLHWSIPDPVFAPVRDAFLAAAETLAQRIAAISSSVEPT